MNGPRTSREALIAEVLGDIDALLARTEALPATVLDAETRIAAAVAALADAGDRYRMAVTAFTEEARTELTGYLERRAGAIAARTVEEQREALQEAARCAFQHEALEATTSMAASLRAAAAEWRRARRWRLLENLTVAFVASGITAALLYCPALLR